MISIRLGQSDAAYAPGDSIHGEVTWTEQERTKTIEARLIWYTLGFGSRDLQIVDRTVWDATPEGRGRFDFQAPRQPYSFSGRLISLVWAVEVVTLPSKKAESATLVIAPERREIDLSKVQGDDPASLSHPPHGDVRS